MGAGGGTLGNEPAQKGVKVVVLEAGSRHEYSDFINDEWAFINDEWAFFAQLAWKDMRVASGSWRVARDFPNLPAWGREDRRRQHRALGRRLLALPGARVPRAPATARCPARS